MTERKARKLHIDARRPVELFAEVASKSRGPEYTRKIRGMTEQVAALRHATARGKNRLRRSGR